MKRFRSYFPWTCLVLTLLYILYFAWPTTDRADEWHLKQFASLPVVQGGRVMPFDSAARLNLMSISLEQNLVVGVVDEDTQKVKNKVAYPAVKWALDAMTSLKGETFQHYRIFLIEEPELLKKLDLPERKDSLYSFRDMSGAAEQLMAWFKEADAKETATRDKTDKAILHLKQELFGFIDQMRNGNPSILDYRVFRIENDQVLNLLQLKIRDKLRYSLNEIGPRLEELEKAVNHIGDEDKKAGGKREHDRFESKVLELASHVKAFINSSTWNEPRLIPPDDNSDQFTTLLQESKDKLPLIAREAYLTMLHTYRDAMSRQAMIKTTLPEQSALPKDHDSIQRFNAALDAYRAQLQERMPGIVFKTSLETWFNGFAPFYHCLSIYLIAMIIGMVSWFGFVVPGLFRPLNRAAMMMTVVTLVVHTFALIARMWIQGRPPVTNLYSSAIFIGWGCVLLCLLFESYFRIGISLVIGNAIGAATLFVAHFLSLDGDTLGMMQAVLDTNFWLATHVVCITLGYTATFVAGGMGIAYILAGFFTPALKRPLNSLVNSYEDSESLGVLGMMQLGTALNKMLYAIVCFAMFLSFVGTVLGGIWADQSWGRFWGWDPKENGALMIVIWNAILLHARWAGLVKQRGLAILAVFGNIVTIWSYFGTNLMGVGLHSYGFMQGAMYWMLFVMAIHAVIIAIGLMPFSIWVSNSASSPARAS